MKAKLLALAALVLGLASCQNEPEGVTTVGGGDEVCVSLNVAIPDDGTRAGGADSAKGAIGNVDLVNDLDVRFILEVYDANGDLAKERLVNYEDTATETAFELHLVPGRDYKFVVWADFVKQVSVTRDPASNYDYHYNTSAGLKKVEVNAATWKAMDESRDAYTGIFNAVQFNSAQTINIPLTRPFAKVRVVTTDIKDLYNNSLVDAKVVYNTNKIYTSFDAYSEQVVEESNGTLDGEYYTIATYTEDKTATTGKQTVFTDYIFGAENGTIKFTLDVNDSKGAIPQVAFVTDIPVQRNYLTTIMGPILTDANNIKVTIEDAFANNPEDKPWLVQSWDGKTLKEPTLNTTTNEYEISEGSQLAWLSEAVAGTLPTTSATRASVNYATQTYVLTADIDLGGNEWKPIGQNIKHFAGVFDGNGHTISNYLITGKTCFRAGLFASVTGEFTIKDLTIDNAVVKYPQDGEDYYASAIVGTMYGNVTFENIVVKNSTITGNNKVGALVGHDGVGSSITVKDCHVYNCYIASEDTADGGCVGGVFGLLQTGGDKIKFTNTTVEDCEIVGINSSNHGDRANSQFIGSLKSKEGQVVTIENCAVKNNTFTETFNVPEGGEQYVSEYDGVFVGGDRDGKRLGVVIINGTRYEADEEPKNVSAEDGEFYATIEDALQAGNNEIAVGDGELDLPSTLAVAQGNTNTTVTITGNGIENTTLNGTKNSNGNTNHPGNYAHGLDLVFENLTLETVNEGYQGGFGHANSVTFRNCKIVGQFYAHSNAPHFFYDCTIDPLTGYLYTYASDCVFERCHFAASEGKALQVYAESAGEFTVTITDCTFKAEKQAQTWDKLPVTGIDINSAKGALMNVYVENCTTEGFPVGLNSGSDLWDVKNDGKDKTNLYIDGKAVWLRDYALVANYPGLFTKDGEYFVFNADGLMSLNKYFKDNWGANHIYQTYNIAADIDAEGYTWDGVFIVTGSNSVEGLILNGNNHTISNLTINNYFLSGTPNGGDEGKKPGEVKNITMDNITVNGGSHDATVFWGSCYGDVNFENVVVKNSTIKGGSNVGALMSRTTIENVNTKVYVNFKNCKVENCEISADNLNADPTGASGFIGRAYGETYMTFTTCSVDDATKINNVEGLTGGRAYGYGVWKDGGWKGVGASDGFVAFNGVQIVETNDIEDVRDITPGEDVTFTEDVQGDAVNGGYSKTGIKHNGGVLDGGMNELIVDGANATWDCAIYTNGGTIKNFKKIGGAFRGIFTAGLNNDLYIDNVIIDDVCYTFNSDDGNKKYGVYISNSTLNGWTSYSDVHKEVVFTNCKFGQGTGGYTYEFCRPYCVTTFENCDFAEGYEMDPRAIVTFKNCTYNGVHLNKDNYTQLVTSRAENVRFE